MDVVKPENIAAIAMKYSLPTGLLEAIIATESSGNAAAWRSEPVYAYLWDCKNNKPFRHLSHAEELLSTAPNDFPASVGSVDTEWAGQRASWGLCQIMGAVARELGFKGHFPNLCGLAGVEYGAKHLSNLMRRFHLEYGIDGVIAAYNAGTPKKSGTRFVNYKYVDKVNSAWGVNHV